MRTTLPLGSFFLFLHLTAFVCSNSPRTTCSLWWCVPFDTLLIIGTPLSLPWCPVRYPFDYHYFTFTTTGCVCVCVCVRFDTLWIIITSLSLLRCVCVRFDTLSIIIISLLLWFVPGSTPFRLSLFHFYYGLCRVQHPFNCH
jgi:hypothetical protein